VLAQLSIEDFSDKLIRYVSQHDEVALLRNMGMDVNSIDEIIELLQENNEIDTIEALLDKPFQPKSQLNDISRYSDGTFPVLYTALEVETAEAEVKHNAINYFLGQSTERRTIYYLRLLTDFNGKTKDLRKKHKAWPDLTHNNNYNFCNEIAREAVNDGLDSLLAPSARNKNGTCTPIFNRNTLSNPETEGVTSFTYDPALDKFI